MTAQPEIRTAATILDGMVAEVQNRRRPEPKLVSKADKPSSVIPTAQTEIYLPGVPFPDDFPLESIEGILRGIIYQAEQALHTIEILRGKKAEAESPKPELAPSRQQAGNAGEAEEADVVNAGLGAWTCPDHGQVEVRTNRRTQRRYRACPVEGCGEFERPR